MKSKKLRLFLVSFAFVIGLSWNLSTEPTEAFSEQVIQQGAVGDDVIELQARLQYIGFYNGKIDGVFGWRTYWAVRNFQYEFGLEVDGFVGETTKQALERSTEYDQQYVNQQINEGQDFTHYGGQDRNQEGQEAQAPSPTAVNVPNGFSQNDIQLMAQAVHGEARGEPYEGKVAVAAVILNRIESSTFPDTISGVIYEPLAFTAVADGQINMQPDESSREAVMDAINGWDPSAGAIYYFNPDTATSDWIWSRPQIKKIGKHIFCY